MNMINMMQIAHVCGGKNVNQPFLHSTEYHLSDPPLNQASDAN
jgi:hypothetical protein